MNKKPINLRQKAFELLARRDYAYHELSTKLLTYTQETTAIKQLLDELVAQDWINDDRFIKNFITRKATRYGPQKLKYLLQQKTHNQELVAENLKTIAIDELENARKVWLQKFKGHIATEQKDKNRQIRFLLSRGFSLNIIFKIINENVNDY